MKRIVIAMLALAALPAAAQQIEEPKIATYKALLAEANDRVAAINAMAAALQEQVKALTAERDKLKAEAVKAAP